MTTPQICRIQEQRWPISWVQSYVEGFKEVPVIPTAYQSGMTAILQKPCKAWIPKAGWRQAPGLSSHRMVQRISGRWERSEAQKGFSSLGLKLCGLKTRNRLGVLISPSMPEGKDARTYIASLLPPHPTPPSLVTEPHKPPQKSLYLPAYPVFRSCYVTQFCSMNLSRRLYKPFSKDEHETWAPFFIPSSVLLPGAGV